VSIERAMVFTYMQKEPLISIITATYNDDRFLADTIRSVIEQTHSNWEWIIVNNGSTDTTQEILDGLDESRIYAIHLNDNLGVSGGRNCALQQAKGAFFCFLDGDDLLTPNSLQSRLDRFTSDQVEFVDGAVDQFDNQTGEVIHTYVPKYKGQPFERLLSLDGSVFMGNTWMIRKMPGKNYSFRQGLTHGEELLFYVQVCQSGLFDYTPETILKYRRHQSSAMSNLHGLLKGYKEIKLGLQEMNIAPDHIRLFGRKSASIMFKSYLKKGQVWDAFRAYFALR